MSALTQMSLLFLTTETQVLLGKKKSSFGKGNKMWSNALHWLPNILSGETLNATFSFTKDLGLESYQIHKGGED